MKVIYFGSPDFSARLLSRLLEEPHFQVVAAVSNPDRPRGRSARPLPTPVAELALERGIPLFRFESLREQESQAALREIGADLGMVFAYGSLIPSVIFQAPRLGSFNLHGSLLPALRGASPVQTALLQGMTSTGWTMQRLAAKMDAGDIVSTCEIQIDPDETAGELMDRMLDSGINLAVQSLLRIEDLLPAVRQQEESLATFCTKLRPADAWIPWDREAEVLHNQIRGMNPSPVARTALDKEAGKSEPILIFRSRLLSAADPLFSELPEPVADGAGRILVRKAGGKKRLLVQTGSKFLEITELQPSGRKRMQAADLLNGGTIADGMRFSLAPQSDTSL